MQELHSIAQINAEFSAIVFDQWGVLHNGSQPYEYAIDALAHCAQTGTRLGVLSNSGRRAQVNVQRIARMGFAETLWQSVLTSGEILWQDIARGVIDAQCLYPIAAHPDDGAHWASGLPITLTDDLNAAQALLLIGIADGSTLDQFNLTIERAKHLGLPMYCANADFSSPRADGQLVLSPGAIAKQYADMGAEVIYYGKPYLRAFQAFETIFDLPAEKILMVGDSLKHDVAGAHLAGWKTLFIGGGLHNNQISYEHFAQSVAQLAAQLHTPTPDYLLATLR